MTDPSTEPQRDAQPAAGPTQPTTAAPAPELAPAALLFPDLDAELEATRRMLERVPDGQDDWRPHEKSMTLRELANHVAELPGFAVMMLAHDAVDLEPPVPPPSRLRSTAERLAAFEELSGKLRDLIGRLTWDGAMGQWQMRIGGNLVLSGARAEMVRRMGLTHIAHHRAQLGVYLRMLGVPIPGTYGPSADEPPPRD